MKYNIFRSKPGNPLDPREVEVEEFYDNYLPLPHCDQSILHAPGECEYCDKYPQAQALRAHWRINFTGHHDADKAPCPSTYFRSDETRDRWPGNRPEGFLND